MDNVLSGMTVGAVTGGGTAGPLGLIVGTTIGGAMGLVAALKKGKRKSESNPSPPRRPPSPPLLRNPWREITWGDKDEDLQYVRNFELDTRNQKIRILLLGPVGAGKSSFINSVYSVLLGRMYTLAGVDNISQDSYTKKYKTYKTKKEGPGSYFPFVFSDTMGLDPTYGIRVDDVILALKGHVKDRYKFKLDCGLSVGDEDYRDAPTQNDKAHILVYVVPANTASAPNSQVLEKLWAIRNEASDLEIPQVTIFTKVDEVSPEIKEDLQNVYRDTRLMEKMEQFSKDLGVPMNCIFPVKNYHRENKMNSDVNSLILDALKNILNFGRDYLELESSNEN